MLRAIDVTTILLILLFLGLFINVIISVIGVFQSEVYTTMINLLMTITNKKREAFASRFFYYD
jgi:hypothetical protein